MNQLDAQPDNIAITALETQFPGWMIYRQCGVCYARNRRSGHQLEANGWSRLRELLGREKSSDSC